MIRVILTDDQELYLEGLALLLSKQPGIEVLATARSGSQLLTVLSSTHPDILLLDLHLPDMEVEPLLNEIRVLQPQLKIIYLTMMRGTRYVHRLRKQHIHGYMLKNAGLEELLLALKKVASGETYFSAEIDITETKNDQRSTITVDGKRVGDILSKRELEILQLICREYTNAEIAGLLNLQVSTIETHRKNMISKLGVTNSVGLVKFAMKNGLID